LLRREDELRQCRPADSVGVVDTILDLTLNGEDEAAFSIKNNDTADAFVAFEVHAAFSRTGPLVPLATAAADFSSPAWPIRRADALVTLAAGATGKIFINTRSIYRLVFKARIGGLTDSTVDIHGQIV
jgi:hypothetical protein